MSKVMKKSTIFFYVLLFLFSSHSYAWEKDELLIWTKPENFGNQGFIKLAKKFERETGKKITIVEPESLVDDQPTRDYNRKVVLNRGPDIFIRTHDRIGELAQAGLIAEVKPKASTLKNINQNYWNAVSYDSRLFGYPISVEGVTQICNAKLVDRAYQSIKEVEQDTPRLKRQNKKAFIWDYMNNYFSYGFITSEGGYTFKFSDGAYNPSNTGVNNQGAIAGVSMIKRLLTNKLLPAEIGYSVVDDAFKNEEVACIVNGPWSWEDYKKSGIDIRISGLPKVDKGQPKVFIGVLSAMVNPSSPNSALVSQFIEDYLLQPSGLAMINADKPLGAVTHNGYMQTLSKGNTRLANASKVWENGEPMPNIPKMARYWNHMDTALYEVLRNNKDVREALEDASERITR